MASSTVCPVAVSSKPPPELPLEPLPGAAAVPEPEEAVPSAPAWAVEPPLVRRRCFSASMDGQISACPAAPVPLGSAPVLALHKLLPLILFCFSQRVERRSGIRQNPCIFAYFFMMYYIPSTDVQYKSFLRFLENFYEINSKMNKRSPIGCPVRQNTAPQCHPAGSGGLMCLYCAQDCVDFEKGTILINKQLRRYQRKGGQYYFSPSKNNKSRTITPAPYVMKLLRTQKARQSEQRLLTGPAWEDSGLVFTNEFGRYVSYRAIFDSFKRMVKRIGIPDARIHDLRIPTPSTASGLEMTSKPCKATSVTRPLPLPSMSTVISQMICARSAHSVWKASLQMFSIYKG